MTPRILIIDDSSDFRELARRFIRIEWPEALVDDWDPISKSAQGLGEASTGYDVLLLDYLLGKDDGLVWLEVLRARAHCPPIIFLTGHGSESIAVQAMKLGASDYLRKHDLSKQRLIQAIADCLSPRREQTRDEHGATRDERDTPVALTRRQERSGSVSEIEIEGYEVDRKIGEGGMSTVYLSRRAGDQRAVVLKILDAELSKNDEFLRRFIREYGIISKIRSPYVVSIYDQGFSSGHVYIAMEYFSAGDLKRRIDAGMREDQALAALSQFAQGLAAIHSSGVIHRDLKPQNVLFRADQSMGILDFGIAKEVAEHTQLTMHGQVFGTPYYMSPEQGTGKPLDGRSDLYSAGVIFYEMLTGQRLYTADNAVSLVYKHIHEPIPKLPGRYARLQELLEKLVAKKPDERFSTAFQLQHYLRDQLNVADQKYAARGGRAQ